MTTQPQSQRAKASAHSQVAPADLDALLTAQFAVAWAGEGDMSGEDGRLGWWRSDLVSEFGGQDLFARLTPNTAPWAVLQAVREAARRCDAGLREKHHDADTLVSLFNLGFELDERADERLLDLKRAGDSPAVALPALAEVLRETWDLVAFQEWLRTFGEAEYTLTPAGRRLKGAQPAALGATVSRLVAALAPPPGEYPLPHFRRTP